MTVLYFNNIGSISSYIEARGLKSNMMVLVDGRQYELINSEPFTGCLKLEPAGYSFDGCAAYFRHKNRRFSRGTWEHILFKMISQVEEDISNVTGSGYHREAGV